MQNMAKIRFKTYIFTCRSVTGNFFGISRILGRKEEDFKIRHSIIIVKSFTAAYSPKNKNRFLPKNCAIYRIGVLVGGTQAVSRRIFFITERPFLGIDALFWCLFPNNQKTITFNFQKCPECGSILASTAPKNKATNTGYL